jgi:hypothetical protein
MRRQRLFALAGIVLLIALTVLAPRLGRGASSTREFKPIPRPVNPGLHATVRGQLA